MTAYIDLSAEKIAKAKIANKQLPQLRKVPKLGQPSILTLLAYSTHITPKTAQTVTLSNFRTPNNTPEQRSDQRIPALLFLKLGPNHPHLKKIATTLQPT